MSRYNPECTICDIISDPEKSRLDVRLFQDELRNTAWRAVLMTDQGAIGATYITTERHCPDIDELTRREWDELYDIMKLLSHAIKSEFNPRHMTLSCDMADADRDNIEPHVHFKLRGRGAPTTSVGREAFSDSRFGEKYVEPHKVGREVLLFIREKLESTDL